MSKRQDSRYSDKEIIVVCDNWESIASEYEVELNLIKTVISSRSLESKVIGYQEGATFYYNLFSFELKIPYESGTIHIKSSETKYPNISFSFSSKSNFEFYLWQEDFMDKFSKWFGTKEMQIGVKAFDNKYFIKTTDEAKMRTVLDRKTINFLIDSELSLFKLENSKFEIGGLINELDISKIKDFIEISKYIIDRINEK